MTPELFCRKRPAVPRTTSAIATLLIDTEEDFDWISPVEGTIHSTAYLSHIADLQQVLAAYGIQPTYLLSYPVLTDATIVRNLQRALERGHCDVGLQLHPWVTPPFAGQSTSKLSFSGNLTAAVEDRKLDCLVARFTECFGMKPRIFRTGRYGLGAHTAQLLEQFGFEIDTSVAPRTSMTDEGGPDYSQYDFSPFWFGKQRDLLELPLCRSVVGWGGETGAALYRKFTDPVAARRKSASLIARSGYAERITLSPEGNDFKAMCRLVQRLRERGQTIFPVSFHSSSLWPGLNPYVQSRADLHWFYDRLSAILSHLADDIGCRFVAAAAIPALLAPPPPRLDPSRPDKSCPEIHMRIPACLDTPYRNAP